MSLGLSEFKDITELDKNDPRHYVWYRVLLPFNIPINTFNPLTHNDPCIGLKEGDIFGMARNEFQTGTDRFEFSSVMNHGDRLLPVIGQRKFFDINHKLFDDITETHIRNIKLDKILE